MVADGADTSIACGTDVSLDDIFDEGGKVSFTMNPKSDGEGSSGNIFYKRNGSNGWIVFVNNESTGFMKVSLRVEFSSALAEWRTTNTVIPIDELSDVSITYNSDSIDNDPIFVINGIKYTVGNGLDEVTTPVGTRVTDTTKQLSIGNFAVTPNQTFDGLIDNPKISDTSRPSSEAITSYNAEKSDSDTITTGTEVTQ